MASGQLLTYRLHCTACRLPCGILQCQVDLQSATGQHRPALEPAACSQAHSFSAVQGTRSGKNVLGFAGVSAIFLFGLPLVILAIAIGSGEPQAFSSALPLGDSLTGQKQHC